MFKTLAGFCIKAFVKSSYSRLCFLVALLIVAAFIIGGTILDARAVADARNVVADRRRQAVEYNRHIREAGYDIFHPTSLLVSAEVRILTSLLNLYMWGQRPTWQETLNWEIDLMQSILSAVNSLDMDTTEDAIHMLPYRFAAEFGSTEGLAQSLRLAQTHLETGVPTLTSPYEMSGFQFLHKSITFLWPPLILLMVAALNGGISVASRTFLHCQPLEKVKIRLALLCVSSALAWLTFIILLSLGFVASAIINGSGHAALPIGEMQTGEMQTAADFVLMGLLISPIYALVCGLIEASGRWILERSQ